MDGSVSLGRAERKRLMKIFRRDQICASAERPHRVALGGGVPLGDHCDFVVPQFMGDRPTERAFHPRRRGAVVG